MKLDNLFELESAILVLVCNEHLIALRLTELSVCNDALRFSEHEKKLTDKIILQYSLVANATFRFQIISRYSMQLSRREWS